MRFHAPAYVWSWRRPQLRRHSSLELAPPSPPSTPLSTPSTTLTLRLLAAFRTFRASSWNVPQPDANIASLTATFATTRRELAQQLEAQTELRNRLDVTIAQQLKAHADDRARLEAKHEEAKRRLQVQCSFEASISRSAAVREAREAAERSAKATLDEAIATSNTRFEELFFKYRAELDELEADYQAHVGSFEQSLGREVIEERHSRQLAENSAGQLRSALASSQGASMLFSPVDVC